MPASKFLFTAKMRTTAISMLSAGLFVFIAVAPRYARGQIAIPSAGNINTIAGDGTAGYVSSQDGNLAVNAELNGPAGVAVDAHGNIYIADASNNRIRMISAQTGDITTVAGNGTGGYVEAQDGGPAISAELNGPTGVAVDLNGNIYIADASNNRIRMVAAKTGDITTVAGNGTQCSNPTASSACGDGGSPTSAELNDPFGVTVDTNGNIYIADTNDLRVRKVTFPPNATPFISTVAGNGNGSYNGDNQPANSATIDHPTGVAVDVNGEYLHLGQVQSTHSRGFFRWNRHQYPRPRGWRYLYGCRGSQRLRVILRKWWWRLLRECWASYQRGAALSLRHSGRSNR